jgi:hypothetical protein
METKSVESIIEEIVAYNPYLNVIFKTVEKEALDFIFNESNFKFYEEFLEIHRRFESNGKLKKGEKAINAMFKGIDYNNPEADKVIASFKAIILALNNKIASLGLEITIISDQNTVLKKALAPSEN